MTQIPNFKSAGIRLILIAILCISASTINARTPLFENNPHYPKIEQVKPGMSKLEVQSILKQPYNLSFYTNDK